MKIKIYKNGNKLEFVREIETDKTWVADRLPSGSSEIGDPNLTDFLKVVYHHILALSFREVY